MRICEVLRIWALLGALFAALPNCAAAVNDGKGKAQQEEQKVYLDATKEPFEINGFPWRDKNGAWYRLPPQLGKSDVNEGALKLAGNTSGGTIRFMTDSPNIHLVAKLRGADMNHMPRAGSAGIDIFLSDSNGENSRYVKTLQPSAQEARGGKPLASSIRLFGKKRQVVHAISSTLRKGQLDCHSRRSGLQTVGAAASQNKQANIVLRLVNNSGRLRLKAGKQLHHHVVQAP